ncbi:MAG: hypothetical protein WAM58_07340 [Candidatus Acidiferrum sp.]
MNILGWIIFVVLLIGYFTCLMWALVLDNDILTEVNSKLPQHKQFQLIGFRRWELRSEYKILFPQGTLLTRSRWLWATSFLCFFTAIATLYWFHLSIRR